MPSAVEAVEMARRPARPAARPPTCSRAGRGRPGASGWDRASPPSGRPPARAHSRSATRPDRSPSQPARPPSVGKDAGSRAEIYLYRLRGPTRRKYSPPR
jgi:hypothetical protein